jgi:hypothetical protein
MGEGEGSPGDSARCRGRDALAGLVGEVEREWGTRGGLPRSLSRAGSRGRAGFHLSS